MDLVSPSINEKHPLTIIKQTMNSKLQIECSNEEASALPGVLVFVNLA